RAGDSPAVWCRESAVCTGRRMRLAERGVAPEHAGGVVMAQGNAAGSSGRQVEAAKRRLAVALLV
ncbi:MAG: hypothetical protein ACMG6H_16125, partial [Acidobacteriota bacterium]